MPVLCTKQKGEVSALDSLQVLSDELNTAILQTQDKAVKMSRKRRGKTSSEKKRMNERRGNGRPTN